MSLAELTAKASSEVQQPSPLSAVAQETPAAKASGVNLFDELIDILSAEQRAELAELSQRLDSPEANLERVDAALHEALMKRRDDPVFASILSPLIERSIDKSIQQDPEVLAESLMPSVQISVRRTVNELFSNMVASLNQTLEHSMNFKWRWEALTTGRSFAEVVLSHTLVYSVEQVFLVDKESGLLLQQASKEGSALEDGDMISAMLTAINDFVRDSFKVDAQESLNTISMGELNVVIEQGRYTYIAAVVRGLVPSELDDILQEIQHLIEMDKREVLEQFSGDTHALEDSRPLLLQAISSKARTVSKRPSPALWLIFIAIAGLLGWWGWHSYRANRKWQNFVGNLKAQTGVIVTKTEHGFGRLRVEGLADRYVYTAPQTNAQTNAQRGSQTDPTPVPASTAADGVQHSVILDGIIEAAGYRPEQISLDLQAYEAPAFAQQRQLAALALPEGVNLRLEDGNLVLENLQFPEHQAWFERARYQALAIEGVDAVKVADAQRIIETFVRDIPQQYFLFPSDSVANYGTSASLNRHYQLVRQRLQALLEAANVLDYPVSITVVSYAGVEDTLTGAALDGVLLVRAQRVIDTLNLPSLAIMFPFRLERQYEIVPLSAQAFHDRDAKAVPFVLPEGVVSDNTDTRDNRANLGHVHLEVGL